MRRGSMESSSGERYNANQCTPGQAAIVALYFVVWHDHYTTCHAVASPLLAGDTLETPSTAQKLDQACVYR